jgi:hypothetical protein
MAEVALHFEFVKDADLHRATGAIRDRLSALEAVKQVDSMQEKPRLTGIEIAAAIAVTIQIVHGTQQLVAEIRKLIPELQGLIKDIKGLREVTVEVGAKRVPIGGLGDAELRQIAAEQGNK